MKDEMCNFYMMFWYDPREKKLGKSVEDSCDILYEDKLDFPMDSDVPLPGSGQKMKIKRNLEDGEFACLLVVLANLSYIHHSSSTVPDTGTTQSHQRFFTISSPL